MSVNNIYLKTLFLLFFSNGIYAADLVDVYNRAIQNNDDYRITKNDKEITAQQYNQTAASIFPEVSFQAGVRLSLIHI